MYGSPPIKIAILVECKNLASSVRRAMEELSTVCKISNVLECGHVVIVLLASCVPPWILFLCPQIFDLR